MPRDSNDTTPEMPAAGVDDEATRIDAKPTVTEPSVPTVPTRPRFGGDEPEEDSGEATKATGTPKKVREAQKILEESRRMNAAGGPRKPAKKLHPLIPLGVALGILAALLLVINWLVKPDPLPDGSEQKPAGMRTLFDW